MSADEPREVWDTLDMYDSLHRAALATGGEDLIKQTKCLGYDRNNESKFMAFTAFSVQRLLRFEYVESAKPGYWNSASGSGALLVAAYRRAVERATDQLVSCLVTLCRTMIPNQDAHVATFLQTIDRVGAVGQVTVGNTKYYISDLAWGDDEHQKVSVIHLFMNLEAEPSSRPTSGAS